MHREIRVDTCEARAGYYDAMERSDDVQMRRAAGGAAGAVAGAYALGIMGRAAGAKDFSPSASSRNAWKSMVAESPLQPSYSSHTA